MSYSQYTQGQGFQANTFWATDQYRHLLVYFSGILLQLTPTAGRSLLLLYVPIADGWVLLYDAASQFVINRHYTNYY